MTETKTKGNVVPVILGIPENARSMAIIDGTVKPEGIQLDCVHKFKSVVERHSAMVQGKFDASEMSTAGFILIRSQGGNQVALPVFFLRGFRQGNIFCRKDSKIKEFADLKGKTIGVTAFHATTIAWVRGILHHDYGVTRDSVSWISAEENSAEPVTAKVKFTILNKKRDVLWEMLDKGDIDAAIFPGNDGYFSFNTGGSLYQQLQKRGNLRTIQDDRKTITEWYKKTGIYPIIHTVTVKLDLARKYPQVPKNLLLALQQSRKLASKYESTEEQKQSAEEVKFLGYDPYGYKLVAAEKKALDTLMDFMVEDGAIQKKLPVESLFAPGII